MLAKLAEHEYMRNLVPFLNQNTAMSSQEVDELNATLSSGLSVETLESEYPERTALAAALDKLSRHGFLEFVAGPENYVVLIPCSRDFEFDQLGPISDGTWRVSRFTYAHYEDGDYIVRNPNADCFLKVPTSAVATLVHTFNKPTDFDTVVAALGDREVAASVCGALLRAGIILPSDANGLTEEDRDPARQQWAFHDLVFHSMSRLGRTEKEIGGTFRFKGILEATPAVKQHSWHDTVIPLPKADLASLGADDLSLTAAMELRRSTRAHSIVPLTKQQIGEFLYRTVRVRRHYENELGDFTSRPYPGGGACYENEFYLTIEACSDIPRGFYYYDAVEHALCLVCKPNDETRLLLDEAHLATARICRPQVLVTIANRFNRFNWKYASMAYAAQLKNVGAIYQTMYLVATAMNIGACGLGLGNTSRFAALTGLPYLEEGSVGEFMLGRPAVT